MNKKLIIALMFVSALGTNFIAIEASNLGIFTPFKGLAGGVLGVDALQRKGKKHLVPLVRNVNLIKSDNSVLKSEKALRILNAIAKSLLPKKKMDIPKYLLNDIEGLIGLSLMLSCLSDFLPGEKQV